MSSPHYTLPQVGEIWENTYLQKMRLETLRFPAVVLTTPTLHTRDGSGIEEHQFDGFCLTRQHFQRYVISQVNCMNWERLA